MSEKVDFAVIPELQKAFFRKGLTKDIQFRKKALSHLRRGIVRYREEIEQALARDLGKHPCESYMTEIGFVLSEIRHTFRSLDKWAAEKQVFTPVHMMPGSSRIRKEPYGTVLIMGPYNYPFLLLIQPLVSAIAAGNCVVLKPSELAPYTAEVVQRMILHIFHPEYVCCVSGGIEENQELLKKEFDYIFFTGSTRVGKIVMRAAAENLIPVTLELGGKSPVIVDRTADIPETARRIIWGKLLNTGQTCVAPDYVLVDKTVETALLNEMQSVIKNLYGEEIRTNPDYGRVINRQHVLRLKRMLEQDREHIVYGGTVEEEDRFVEPCILALGDSMGERVRRAASMQEELFGPVLPVISFRRLQEAVAFVQAREKPLALYLFTGSDEVKEMVLSQTASGGVSVNDTIEHIISPYMPFGGVGKSGIGQYHGKFGFDTFSHMRSVYEKPVRFHLSPGYPPYTAIKQKLVERFLK